MNLHTDEMERREAAVTSNNKKNALMEVKLNVMFPSLSHRQRTTTAYAHSAHCVLHRNGNKQQRGKARHVSPCAAARRCAQARQENEPFWQVAEVRREREREDDESLRFVCCPGASLLMVMPGSTPPAALADAPPPPPWMRASSSSPNPK
jgi:hypothetical protein